MTQPQNTALPLRISLAKQGKETAESHRGSVHDSRLEGAFPIHHFASRLSMSNSNLPVLPPILRDKQL